MFDARTTRATRQKCEATVPKRWYEPQHRCPYAASFQVNGVWLCGNHARALASRDKRRFCPTCGHRLASKEE